MNYFILFFVLIFKNLLCILHLLHISYFKGSLAHGTVATTQEAQLRGGMSLTCSKRQAGSCGPGLGAQGCPGNAERGHRRRQEAVEMQ